MNPKTLSEAEVLVAQLENAMELVRGGQNDRRQHQNEPRQGWRLHQRRNRRIGQSRGQTRVPSLPSRFMGHYGRGSVSSSSQFRGRGRSRGQGSAGPHPRPPQRSVVVVHPHNRTTAGSGQSGSGQRDQRRSGVAIMATSDELREMADQWDREAGQLPAVKGSRRFPKSALGKLACHGSGKSRSSLVDHGQSSQRDWTIPAVHSPGEKRRRRR